MRVLVVGSSDIDIFATLADPKDVSIADGKVTLNLGDKIPVEVNRMTVGGNGANVSVGFARLGLETSFYTYLANDSLAPEIKKRIDEEGISLLSSRVHETSTSLSYILDFERDRIIFANPKVRDHEFDIQDSQESFELVYLTSIGEEWESAYRSVLRFIQNTKTKLAFSPGAPQLHDINETFDMVLKSSDYLLLNLDEARKILSKYGVLANTPAEVLERIQALGPKVVSVTDGGDGAYAKDSQFFKIQPFEPSAKTVDKTGAGDAYASAFLAAKLLGKETQDAMRWGGVNSHFVMLEVGAEEGLLKKDKIEEATNGKPEYVAHTE